MVKKETGELNLANLRLQPSPALLAVFKIVTDGVFSFKQEAEKKSQELDRLIPNGDIE